MFKNMRRNNPKMFLAASTLFSAIFVAAIFIYTHYDMNRFNQEFASFNQFSTPGVQVQPEVNPDTDFNEVQKIENDKEGTNVVQKQSPPPLLDSKTREALVELLGSDYESKISEMAAYDHLDLETFKNTYVLENGQTIAEAQAANKALALEVEATLSESKALEAKCDALITHVNDLLSASSNPLSDYVLTHYSDRDFPLADGELMNDPKYVRLFYEKYPILKEIAGEDGLLNTK